MDPKSQTHLGPTPGLQQLVDGPTSSNCEPYGNPIDPDQGQFFFFSLCKQEQSTAMLGYGFYSALFELLNVVSFQFCHLDTRKNGWNCFGMLLSYYREFRGYKCR